MAEIFHPQVLIPWLLAMAFGIFVGATPGLTATMAVALVVPLTFNIGDPTLSLALIIGVSFTAIYAGDLPATFLRIPGTPASAAAMLDGYPMALRGQGGLAAQINLLCSAFGGMLGVGILALAAPALARIALDFSSFEYFWLAIAGLSICALVSQGRTLEAWFSGALGILLSMVGLDQFGGATQRYTFGSEALYDGIPFIAAMIGLFGISEVLRNLEKPATANSRMAPVEDRATLGMALKVLKSRVWLWFRSSTLGSVIGALPGAGADIAAWGAYGLAKKTNGVKEDFGEGAVSGVVAPSSANNAAVAGAWIPALVFGIPGDAVTAIVLGAFLIYGIKPGPLIFDVEQGNREQLNQIFAIAFMTQIFLIPAGWVALRSFRLMLRAPRALILSSVVVFSTVGAFALRSSWFDVFLMYTFGVLGWLLERNRIPLAPLILGLILGPMIEENLRNGLIKADGAWTLFFTRPICAALVGLLVVAYGFPIARKIGRRIR